MWLICRNKWHPGTSEISTPSEIALGTHFYARHGTKTIPVFLPANGKASWLLLLISVSLLSGGTVQPENTYSCILKVTIQVRESQEDTFIQIWKTVYFTRVNFLDYKIFNFCSWQIKQNGSLLTILVKTIEFPQFLIKFVKLDIVNHKFEYIMRNICILCIFIKSSKILFFIKKKVYFPVLLIF